jgi:hypothetical protein
MKMSSTNVNNKLFNVQFGKQRKEGYDPKEVVNKKGWVDWGKKNDTPQFLVDLLNTSPLHQGIINGKVSYIVNEGFEVTEGELDEVLKNGASDYDLHEVADAVANDLEIFGAFVLKITLNNLRNLAFIEWLDFDLCRLSEDEDIVYYCEDWSDSKAEVKNYYVYDESREDYVFCLVFKQPFKRGKKELGIYPKPSYIAGLKDIETDREISNYHLNEILNGFTGGTVINVPTGIPETDEEKKNAADYIRKFTGTDEAGSVIVNFSDGQEQAISVVHLNGNDLDKRYLATEESIKSNIITAHSVPNPMLVGISTAGKLGGGMELDVAFNIWNKTYITKRQRMIENAFNYVIDKFSINKGELRLSPAKLPETMLEGDSRVAQSLNSMSALVANNVLRNLTINEIRALAQLPPIDGGDQLNNVNLNFSKQPVQLRLEKKREPWQDVIDMFSAVGKPLTECEVFDKVEVPHGTKGEQMQGFEADCLRNFFDEIGTLTASGKLLSVLDLVRKGDPISLMPEILDTDLATVMKQIKRLQDLGYIDGINVTNRGIGLLNASNVPTDDFEVRYTYELRDGITGDKVIETTRDFCRELIGLDRAFTREEIDTVSGRVGRDVWFERGGWYHNPNTGQTTPFCRHIWKFILTKKQ